MYKLDLPAFHTHFSSPICQEKQNWMKITKLTKHQPEKYVNKYFEQQNIVLLMNMCFDHTKMKPGTSGIQF